MTPRGPCFPKVHMPQPIPEFVPAELQALGLEVPAEILERLASYLDLLLEANERFNLTAVRDRDSAWRRHIIDSMTVLPELDELPENAAVIDVGSGGGLPGIPIAIARPDLRVTLLEATGKKANFLRDSAKALPLPNVNVVHARAETAGRDKPLRQQFDAAVCRAVGPMRELLEYCLPFVKVGGLLVAMKGPKAKQELEEAGDALHLLGAGQLDVVSAYPEGVGIDTVLVVIRKERPTPSLYPRLPGTPRHTPL